MTRATRLHSHNLLLLVAQLTSQSALNNQVEITILKKKRLPINVTLFKLIITLFTGFFCALLNSREKRKENVCTAAKMFVFFLFFSIKLCTGMCWNACQNHNVPSVWIFILRCTSSYLQSKKVGVFQASARERLKRTCARSTRATADASDQWLSRKKEMSAGTHGDEF